MVQSYGLDEVVPLGKIRVKNDLPSQTAFVVLINGSFDFIGFRVYIDMNSQTGIRGSHGGTSCGILQREERSSAPAAVDLRKAPVLNRIEFGAVRRIMHDEDVHAQSVGKLHEVLLDDAVRTGVGAASVAQDDHRMRIRILSPQFGLPYPFDIVADELGGVMVGPEGKVDLVPVDIIEIFPSANVSKSW